MQLQKKAVLTGNDLLTDLTEDTEAALQKTNKK
jgi:hypothetical protein